MRLSFAAIDWDQHFQCLFIALVISKLAAKASLQVFTTDAFGFIGLQLSSSCLQFWAFYFSAFIAIIEASFTAATAIVRTGVA